MRNHVIVLLCFCLFCSSVCQQAEVERLSSELETTRSEVAELTRKVRDVEERAEKLAVENEAFQGQIKDDEATMAEMRTDFQEQLDKETTKSAMLREAYNDLRTADETEYAHLAELIQNEEWEKAAAGLKAFLRSHPQSSLIEEARKQYEKVVREVRRLQTQKAVARQRELVAQREAKLKSNIESGNVSLDQIKPHLINKTEVQVRDLLGSPSSTYTGNKRRYSDQVYNPYVGAKTSLWIQFGNGVVSEVGYGGQK